MRPRTKWLPIIAALHIFICQILCQPALAQENKPEKNEDPTVIEKPETGDETAKPGQDEKFYPFSTKDGVAIDKFIHWASIALDVPFVWSPTAKQQAKAPNKKITATLEMKIPHHALLDFVRTNLRVHDLALVPLGPPGAQFILIEHLTQPTLLKSHRKFVPSDELEEYKNSYIPIVTTLHVKHVNVQQIQTQIQRLSTHQQAGVGQIIPAPSENAFIIMDFAPDVYNLARLIREMDKQGVKFDQTLGIIQLEFASAGEIEAMLSEILQEDGAGGMGRPGQPGIPQGFGGPRQPPDPKILPDERANRLVVYATPEDHEIIQKLVKQLDTDVPASTGDVTVYPLMNTVAEDIVTVLEEIMTEQGGGSRRRSPGGGPTQGSMSTLTGGDKVTIVADKASNAVLIRGSKSRVQEVIEIIKKLDIRKPQVLVEAAILELQHDNIVNLGVELGAFDAKSDLSSTFRPFGYTNMGLSSISVTENGIFRVPNVGSQGVIGGIFDGDGFLFPVLVRAFQEKGYTNLLSMPSILTNDNQEASIKISRSIPYSQLNQGSVGQVSTQTFGDYAEAPIELTISPHISSEDYLRLDITFLVEVFGVGGGQGIPPPKTTRNIETSVTVPNGATVVIGGLTLDDQQESINQVPILGDLPLIGFLFRSTETRHTKNTLYLFLTPRILADPQFKDLDEISTQKKAEIAKLDGQVEIVDPEFGRRIEILDQARSIQDMENTGAFDIPVLHSPTDTEEKEEPEQPEDEKTLKKPDKPESGSKPESKSEKKSGIPVPVGDLDPARGKNESAAEKPTSTDEGK